MTNTTDEDYVMGGNGVTMGNEENSSIVFMRPIDQSAVKSFFEGAIIGGGYNLSQSELASLVERSDFSGLEGLARRYNVTQYPGLQDVLSNAEKNARVDKYLSLMDISQTEYELNDEVSKTLDAYAKTKSLYELKNVFKTQPDKRASRLFQPLNGVAQLMAGHFTEEYQLNGVFERNKERFIENAMEILRNYFGVKEPSLTEKINTVKIFGYNVFTEEPHAQTQEPRIDYN